MTEKIKKYFNLTGKTSVKSNEMLTSNKKSNIPENKIFIILYKY